MTTLNKKQLFRDMQEHPENYSDEQLERNFFFESDYYMTCG